MREHVFSVSSAAAYWTVRRHVRYTHFRFLVFFLVRGFTVPGHTASSSVEWGPDKPPSSFVRGHESTVWDIVLVSATGAPVRRHHLFLRASRCPSCAVRYTHWRGPPSDQTQSAVAAFAGAGRQREKSMEAAASKAAGGGFGSVCVGPTDRLTDQ